MRKTLTVLKQDNGQVAFIVDGLTVKHLPSTTTFEQVRQQAYEFVWARPTYMWTILGATS